MKNTMQHISTEDTYKPKPENIQVKSKENNYLENSSKIPKSIKIFFLILHLVFGQDFGFGILFGKKVDKFVKYYSAALALTTIVILGWPLKLIGQGVWYWSTLIECVVNFCILKTTKYTVYDLLSDIHAAERIDVLEKETLGIITSLYALSMFIIKGFIVAIRCMLDYNIFCVKMNLTYLTFYALCCDAVDLMPDSQIIIHFYIYVYVNNMERILKQDQNVNKFIERYNKIADCQDKIRHICDYFTLVELLANGPKLISTAWFMLNYIKVKRKWFTTMGEWVVALHLGIQIVIPAVFMQLVKCKLNEIRQLLNKWIMVEKDPHKNAELVLIMKYLNVRNLQYKIWGIIPTDLRLPLTLISICTTYLIVIIQFTHLYD